MVDLLGSVRRPIDANSEGNEALFISFLKSKECLINTWTILMPQIQAKNAKGVWNLPNGTDLRVVERKWKAQSLRLGTIGDKHDRLVAHVLSETKVPNDTKPADLERIPQVISNIKSKNRAVVLLYPIRPPGHTGLPLLGFECVVPVHKASIGWVVIDPKQDAPLVPALPTQIT